MFHQPFFYDKPVVTKATQKSVNNKLDILVNGKAFILSKKTSNPQRVLEVMLKVIGLQSHHQMQIGRLRFMSEMVHRNVFTNEIETLSLKTLY